MSLTRAELFDQWAHDAALWTSDICRIQSYGPEGIIPFRPNAIQRDYITDIWAAGVQHDLCPKPRKYGFTMLRLALGLHAIHYLPGGRNFRIICHRLETAQYIKGLLRSLVESSRESVKALGDDPDYYLRPVTSDNALGYDFAGGSVIRIDTAAGKGVGQADRNDDLYLTEFSEYDRPLANLEALMGSQPVGHPDCRFTIDFNAVENWMSTECYTMLKSALKGPGDPDWNGFTVFFRGVDALPEYYSADKLDIAERTLRHRFRAIYPRTLEDLYVQQDKCVHKLADIEAAHSQVGGQYLLDYLKAQGKGTKGIRFVHGVDTATGLQTGDWQVCVTFGFYENIWWEACEPIRERVPEDVFAGLVDERVRRLPGLCVVERNVGSAVLTRLRELDTPGLYRHRHRDKDGKHRLDLGFPTTYATKRQMIADTDRLLREQSLGLVTEELRGEFRDVEWYDSGGMQKPMEGRRQPLAGAPERSDAHDDLWMGANLAIAGIMRAESMGETVVQYRDGVA